MKNYTTILFSSRKLLGWTIGMLAWVTLTQSGMSKENKVQAPGLQNPGPDITFTEDSGPVVITESIQASDDGTGIRAALVKMTGGYRASEDRLLFQNTSTVEGIFDPQKGELILVAPANTAATAENFQSALRTVRYQNINGKNPAAEARTISFTLIDSQGNPSSAVTKKINISPQNDAPQLLNIEREVIFLTKSSRIAITSSISISDVDSEQLTGAVIRFIDGSFQSTIVDQLDLPQSVGNITGSWNPVEGVLTLSGTDTKANYEKALRESVYTFTDFFLSANPMVKKISFTVNDGASVSEAAIRYIAVKNPPSTSIPSWVSDLNKNLNEDNNLVFNESEFRNSYAPDPAKFTFLDIRTLPAHGTLIFKGKAITFNDIINNGSSFRINAAEISQLTFQPAAHYAGPDQFTWNSFDGQNFATNDAAVNLTIAEVNDPPGLVAPAAVNNIPEDTFSLLPAITLKDVDDAQFQVELKVEHGILSVSPYLLSNQLLIFTSGDGQSDKLLQFTGSLTAVNLALNTLQYQPDNNFSGTDQLSIKVTDRVGSGTPATATATVQLIVIPSNDPPVLAGIPTEPIIYTENDGSIPLAPEATVTDEENHQIISATITVQEGFQPNEDSLSFTPSSNISGTITGNQLTLNGVASLAAYQQVIRSVAYKNISEKPTATNRLITFQVKDEEEAVSAVATLTVSVQAVDDPPVLSNIETNPLNFVQFGGPVSLTKTIKIADLDDEIVENARISFVENSYVKNEDVLSFTNTDKINGSWNAESGILTLTGTTTLADYQLALRNVLYENTSENPDEKARTVSFQVSSHGTPSNVLTRKISIVVNERPTIASFGKETPEDQPITFSTEDFLSEGQYQDPDNFPEENGFSAIAIRTLPAQGLLVVGEDTLSQALLDASPSGYEIPRENIAQLVYVPTKDYSGEDSFAWNAFDGAQYATDNAAVAITLTPVNDAPTVQNFEKRINEEDTLLFSSTDFTSFYQDVEGEALQKIVIRSVPAGGSLVLNGIVVPANTEIGLDNINNLLYIPAENFSGTDSFSWSASDGSLFAEPAALASLLVAPINDPPLLKDFTKAIAENEALSFLAEDFTRNYIDVENDPLAYITIGSLTVNGQLLLNGLPVNVGDQISASEIGQFTYQPNANLGGGRDAFNWNASDGTLESPQEATVNIIIGIGVTDFSIALLEDESYTFSADDFVSNYGNPGGSLQEIRIETLPTQGALSLEGSPVTAGQTIPLAALNNLMYTPNQHIFGEDSISWNASDGNEFTGETAQILISIQSVNDAPEISAIESVTVVAGESTGPLPFTISDVESETSSLTLTAFSENKTLISDNDIILEGSGNDRSITVNTPEGQQGEAVITLLVTDGEQQVQQSFTVNVVPYFITVEAGESIDVCHREPFDIAVKDISGGVAPYTYAWTCNQPDCRIQGETAGMITIQPEETTAYYVQVTDANGIVSNQDTILVSMVNCGQIELSIPSGFTPNGDGINDNWIIENISFVNDVTVAVFDRYGQEVFRSEGYPVPWDGTSGTNNLPVGTYYYLINVENGVRVFKGAITILR